MSSTQGYDPALLQRRHELNTLAKRRSNRVAAIRPCFPKGLESDRVTKKQQQARVKKAIIGKKASMGKKVSFKKSYIGKKPSISVGKAKIEHVEHSEPFNYFELFACHLERMDKVRRRLRRALTYVTNVCTTKRARIDRLSQLRNTICMAQIDIYNIKEEFMPSEEA
ncbi:hypothetical protein BDV97DRAFT_354385 [Delphinella strobiligena]|nr:hypothetical protein BDV97DRAFT_354385 [Delphinella strobiligena]